MHTNSFEPERILSQRRSALVPHPTPCHPEEQLPEDNSLDAIERAVEHEWAAMLTRHFLREEEEAREIDAALDRVRRGTYGTCERCGGRIERDRLEAEPVTRTCAVCS